MLRDFMAFNQKSSSNLYFPLFLQILAIAAMVLIEVKVIKDVNLSDTSTEWIASSYRFVVKTHLIDNELDMIERKKELKVSKRIRGISTEVGPEYLSNFLSIPILQIATIALTGYDWLYVEIGIKEEDVRHALSWCREEMDNQSDFEVFAYLIDHKLNIGERKRELKRRENDKEILAENETKGNERYFTTITNAPEK